MKIQKIFNMKKQEIIFYLLNLDRLITYYLRHIRSKATKIISSKRRCGIESSSKYNSASTHNNDKKANRLESDRNDRYLGCNNCVRLIDKPLYCYNCRFLNAGENTECHEPQGSHTSPHYGRNIDNHAEQR